MSLSTSQTVAIEAATRNPATGQLANPDSGPTAVWVVNGVDTGTSVSITNKATGRNKFSTAATLTNGDTAQIRVSATFGSIVYQWDVFTDICGGPQVGKTFTFERCFSNKLTGLPANFDSTPTAMLVQNGDDVYALSVANKATGLYTFSTIFPSLVGTDNLQVRITGTIAGSSYTAEVPVPALGVSGIPTPPTATGVTAANIAERLIYLLQTDGDLTELLPSGATIESIIPDGAGSNGPTVAGETLREQWNRRAMGGPGIGSYSLDLTFGVVVQVRQSDKAGTPYLTKKQETDITDQTRTSILKHQVDYGTPRLWTDLRPTVSQFSNVSGVQRGVTLVTVKSTHVRNPI